MSLSNDGIDPLIIVLFSTFFYDSYGIILFSGYFD